MIETQREMRNAFLRAANREVTVTEGGKARRVAAIDAVFYRLIMEALKGDHRSIKLVMSHTRDMLKEHEDWQIRFHEMVWQIEKAMEEEHKRP